MKKTLLLLLTAALGTALSASAQTVTSVNAVGMVKITVPSTSLVFVTVPFNVTSGTGLNDVIGNQLTGALVSGQSDRIIVWDSNTSTYKSYWKVAAPGFPDFDGKWFLDDGAAEPVPANAVLTPGKGFWVQSRQNTVQTLVISGEVPSESVSMPVLTGLNQLGFPYPTNINVNDQNFKLNVAATGALISGQSDRIIYWNTASQNYTALWLVSGSGLAEYDGFWHFDDGAAIPVRADVSFNAGEGFWFQKRNAVSTPWQPVKPYSWPGQ